MNNQLQSAQTSPVTRNIEEAEKGMPPECLRALYEVKGKMLLAKQFPRCQATAYKNIMTTCQRIKVAEVAMYSYPRGGQTVTGASIRLAEALAQNWGNLDFGVREIKQYDGESVVEAYCWDLETNVNQRKEFIVKHVRKTKKMTYAITDPRDIYEHVANQGSRRLRACVLGVIPKHIIDDAIEQCNKTLHNGDGTPLIDRVNKMVNAFSELGVNVEMLVQRLGHKIDVTTGTELVSLTKIFVSLRDSMSKPSDWFDIKTNDERTTSLNEKFKVEGKKAENNDRPGNKT